MRADGPSEQMDGLREYIKMNKWLCNLSAAWSQKRCDMCKPFLSSVMIVYNSSGECLLSKPTSSTSKTSAELGGMTLPKPREPKQLNIQDYT